MAKREAPVTQQSSPAGKGPDDQRPFWKTKTLDQMSAAEWESLCDGCGRCCLNKIEDEDTGRIYVTKVACKLLDVRSCQCRDYPNRQAHVPDCIRIDPEQVRSLSWLPETCGYRRVEEGRPLAWWHPLVSGSVDTVHQAGVSLRGWAKSERRVKAENFSRYLIDAFPEPNQEPNQGPNRGPGKP
jgi:uncharacterized protein